MKILIRGPVFKLSELWTMDFHLRLAWEQVLLYGSPDKVTESELKAVGWAELSLGWVIDATMIEYLCQELQATPETMVRIDQEIDLLDPTQSHVDSLSWIVRPIDPSSTKCVRVHDFITNQQKRWLSWERWSLLGWLGLKSDELDERPEGIDRCFDILPDKRLGLLGDLFFILYDERTGGKIRKMMEEEASPHKLVEARDGGPSSIKA